MSGSQPVPPDGQQAGAAAADPSMEDILASIRRILSEDETPASVAEAEAPPPAPPPPPHEEPEEPDVLALDASMLVAEPPEPEPPRPSLPDFEPPHAEPPQRELPPALEADPGGLMAPEPVAAAASSVGSLMRTLAGHHGMAVYRGGPTVEDIVREEMRPMLKAWLDENLPPLVERLVRAEIDRVVGRAIS
jgi:hypothetical protein